MQAEEFVKDAPNIEFNFMKHVKFKALSTSTGRVVDK